MAHAQTDDSMMFPADSRMRILPYDESDVYTIPTKYGYQTSIVFGSDEQIETISMGDRSLWQIIPSGNRIFIRPMLDDVITNMTVITNKRSYQFDIKSVSEDSKNTNIIYVAKFVYPDQAAELSVSAYDAQIDTTQEPEKLENVFPEAVTVSDTPPPSMPAIPENITPSPVSESTRSKAVVITPKTSVPIVGQNFNYTFAGPNELAPLQVFDDGKSTYFKYQDAGQPLPNAYIISADGSEKPVGHYVKNGLMIVDDIAGEWVLKSSAGAIMIYNEHLNPSKE
ncbi:MAG: TrbG/VirB9 family P-type conjugative transfer protein [Alphaproteobacteria bacterium]